MHERDVHADEDECANDETIPCGRYVTCVGACMASLRLRHEHRDLLAIRAAVTANSRHARAGDTVTEHGDGNLVVRMHRKCVVGHAQVFHVWQLGYPQREAAGEGIVLCREGLQMGEGKVAQRVGRVRINVKE